MARKFVISIILLMGSLAGFTQEKGRPNIVLITTDQQMADALSARMGDEWIHTPHMDQLVSDGVYFDRAYSANPLCVPSRNSMITGLYPHTTKIQANDDLTNWDSEYAHNHFWDGQDFKSMGTYFKENGYETAYFGKWHVNYDTKDKTAHGFETIENYFSPVNDRSVVLGVRDFLKQKHEKPFLIWVSFLNPHNVNQWSRFQALPQEPVGALAPVNQLPPLPENLNPVINETEAITLIRKAHYENTFLFPQKDYSHFDWRRLRWGYYRLIEKVDAQIGDVIAFLKKNGYYDNTVILFTSDHGTGLGAHKFVQKTTFFDESARVPFILISRGKIKGGVVNHSLINTGVDIMPTLMDFAKIDIPDKLPGRSIKEVSEGNTVLGRDYVVSEDKFMQGGVIDGHKPIISGRMVRSERFKYCLYDTLSHREALFDLKKDPGETINIAEEKEMRPVLLRHRAYLKEFALKTGDRKALEMLRALKDK